MAGCAVASLRRFALRAVRVRKILPMATSSTDRVRAFRARQRAKLQADPDAARLRAVDDMLAPAVRATVEALNLGPEDTAAAQVALQLARVIDQAADQAWAYRWLAPHMLAALEALNATPMARARVKGPVKGPDRTNWLAELRAARPANMGRMP